MEPTSLQNPSDVNTSHNQPTDIANSSPNNIIPSQQQEMPKSNFQKITRFVLQLFPLVLLSGSFLQYKINSPLVTKLLIALSCLAIIIFLSLGIYNGLRGRGWGLLMGGVFFEDTVNTLNSRSKIFQTISFVATCILLVGLGGCLIITGAVVFGSH
jgi:hypothetical protein